MGDLAVPGRRDGRNASVGAMRPSVPAMPVIRPSEQYSGPPYPLLEGLSPTIGWQWAPAAKGGPAFVIISRTMLGSFKVLQRFPLTDDGWAKTWHGVVKLSPDAAGKIRVRLEARAAEDRNRRQRFGDSPEIAELDARSFACLREVALLGGYAPGADMAVGKQYDVRFLEDRLIVCPCRLTDVLAQVPYSEVEAVEIGGPGLVKSGGGFIGGGFGAAGAVEGMAVAAVLNALTTRTSIKTVVRVQGTGCELFLLHARATPEQVRIDLSRPLGAIRSARASALPGADAHHEPARPASSPVEELTKLASMLQSGLLTREEFDHLKAKLLADS